MSTGPLKVKLPVCPRCGLIGKLPVNQFVGKGMCTGAAGASHSKVRMVPTTFVAVVNETSAVGAA